MHEHALTDPLEDLLCLDLDLADIRPSVPEATCGGGCWGRGGRGQGLLTWSSGVVMCVCVGGGGEGAVNSAVQCCAAHSCFLSLQAPPTGMAESSPDRGATAGTGQAVSATARQQQ